MLKRVITAIIGIPLALGLMYIGDIWLALAAAFFTGLSLYEYCRLLEHKSYQSPAYILAFFGGGLVFSLAYFAPSALIPVFFSLLLLLAVWVMVKNLPWDNIAALFFACIYYVVGFGAILLLRQEAADFRYILFAFLIAWTTDSGAYFIGCNFGRHKLAPAISPKKTIEGAVGGIFFSFLIMLVYAHFFLPQPLPLLAGIIVLSSVSSQLGDLLESSLKRWAGQKDSGRIFPGHGGALDRFDGMMLIAPLIYLLLFWPG